MTSKGDLIEIDGRLTKELVEEMVARVGFPVKQGYGLTEYNPCP
jgi:long-subunit acyl-CoA synthetase (AMP-forming)